MVGGLIINAAMMCRKLRTLIKLYFTEICHSEAVMHRDPPLGMAKGSVQHGEMKFCHNIYSLPCLKMIKPNT